MRWKKKDKSSYQSGDLRIVSFFAILPLTVGEETRWLEQVTVKQVYVDYCYLGDGDFESPYWKTIAFINEDKSRKYIDIKG